MHAFMFYIKSIQIYSICNILLLLLLLQKCECLHSTLVDTFIDFIAIILNVNKNIHTHGRAKMMVNWVWEDRKDRFCVENFKNILHSQNFSSSFSSPSTDTQFISFMLFWRILMLLSVFWWYLKLYWDGFMVVWVVFWDQVGSGMYLGVFWEAHSVL